MLPDLLTVFSASVAGAPPSLREPEFLRRRGYRWRTGLVSSYAADFESSASEAAVASGEVLAGEVAESVVAAIGASLVGVWVLASDIS